MESDRSILARQIYFDKTVHNQAVKDCISGKNEEYVIGVLRDVGFVLGKDFVRQHPVGKRYVLDFAFVNEQVAVEVDGKTHLEKKQKRKDTIRDRYLRENDWITIRIQDSDFRTRKLSFYKYLIREIVDERREQWNSGRLYPIDFTNFNEKDFE